MSTKTKNLFATLGLLFGVAFLLTALGCKKQTSPPTETAEISPESPQITYPTGDQGTSPATPSSQDTQGQGETKKSETSEVSPSASPSPTPTTESPSLSPQTTSPSPQTTSPSPTFGQETPTSPSPSPSPTESQNPNDEEQMLQKQAEKLAQIYGTFTNKDKEPYKNYKELKNYATTRMQAWLDSQIKKPIEEDENAPFYGVTVKALSSAIIESSANAKKILVMVKKEEITSTRPTPQVSYKILLVQFVKEKENEEWKLDGIYWQE